MKPTPSRSTTLLIDATVPDLTSVLQQSGKRIVGTGSFGTVYRCKVAEGENVAVKAITFPRSLNEDDKAEFIRKMKRELGIWRRLNHPNIVPLIGKASGEYFASDHLCMVSMWMPHGTLYEFVKPGEALPLLHTRIQLIQGSVAGLEYLHSESIIHGDFHPGNILIDSDHNPRITDFGLSRTLTQEDQLTYLWTGSNRSGAALWVAPELLRHGLDYGVSLNSDIYSLGSIIYFTLSGKCPWKNKADLDDYLDSEEEPKSPSRPAWPVITDAVWDLIEQCWSLQVPENRPSAEEVGSFCRDRLEQELQPNPTSDINVVLFGALGCGKSSIINLLAGNQVAPVSTNMEPCTKRPRCYQIPIGERQFRVWDTMGFGIPRGGEISPLSPYEQAHAVLRDLPDGIHLILLCARKDAINPSLRGLYWLINDIFFGGRAPLAFIVTHSDNPGKLDGWWKQKERSITKTTSIPVQEFIPRALACVSKTQAYQSGQILRSFLEKHATYATPIPLRLDVLSYEMASRDIAIQCQLSDADAAALVDKFRRGRKPLNVVLFGKAGVGKSSIINLVAEHPVAQVSSSIDSCTSGSISYPIDTPTNQFVLWDTMGFSGVRDGHDMARAAIVNVVQLIRELLAGSSVDLLIFVKGSGKPTASELNHYRLIEEFLCGGRVPVAVIVTHLENDEVMEQWWEANGNGLLNVLPGNVVGHACITSLASHDSKDAELGEKLPKSRMAVQALLDSCSIFSRPGEGTSVQLGTENADRVPEAMTVGNLEKHCGLPKELAKEVIKLYNDGG